MNAEAGHSNAVACNKDWDGFGRRDIRIEFEVDPRPAMELARDFRPFPD
jgi:hypothetical protein